MWRIQRGRWWELGWQGMTTASSRAAAGARGFAGPALRCANKMVVALVLLYGTQRVQRTHAWDQKVTGASPATSPCGGASRLRWRERLELEIGHGLGGNEAGAHGDHDETVGVLGEGLGRQDGDGDLRRPKLEDESRRSSWGVRALGACSRWRNGRWRSLQTARGGERSMVGVVAANDGGVRVREGKRAEKGERVGGE